MDSEFLPADSAQTRRALLAAAAGGVIAAVAGALGRPTPALATHLQGFGHANAAGAANTSLTTSSTGTALLVTQNGAGTALRGSAVGPGSIAGFFTANNGTGISGVTGNAGKYGVYGANDAVANGTGAAIRADGKQNHGLVATTANASASAVRGINTSGGSGPGVYGEGPTGVQGNGADTGVQGASGSGYGVRGISTSAFGVIGSSGSGVGVYAISTSASGVYGHSDSASGVYGASDSDIGVYGLSNSGIGVRGQSTTGIGLYGSSFFEDGLQGVINTAFKAGVAGANPNVDGWAGYFSGNVIVTGTFNGTGSLSRIDHPLDPANQTLAHAFVGSPEMLNIYRGTVTLDPRGQGTVTLPAYFEALNTDVHYQLTPIGAAAPDLHVAAEVQEGQFRIAGGPPGAKVCWIVTGVRQDAYAKANPIAVEAPKPAARRGRYLHPSAHGQPESKGWKDFSAPAPPPKGSRSIQPTAGTSSAP